MAGDQGLLNILVRPLRVLTIRAYPNWDQKVDIVEGKNELEGPIQAGLGLYYKQVSFAHRGTVGCYHLFILLIHSYSA